MTEPRQPYGGLTEEEVEHLVERVTERVVENFYMQVGKNVVQKFFYLVGILAVAGLAWLGLTGKLKAGL